MKVLAKSASKAVAAAGTAEALSATVTVARQLVIRAPAANTGNIFLGDSTVDSSSGFVLEPGDTLDLRDDERDIGKMLEWDLTKVFIDAAVNGESVSLFFV